MQVSLFRFQRGTLETLRFARTFDELPLCRNIKFNVSRDAVDRSKARSAIDQSRNVYRATRNRANAARRQFGFSLNGRIYRWTVLTRCSFSYDMLASLPVWQRAPARRREEGCWILEWPRTKFRTRSGRLQNSRNYTKRALLL